MIWLNKGYEARFNPSILLRTAFDALRSDAQFKELLPYWPPEMITSSRRLLCHLTDRRLPAYPPPIPKSGA